MKKQFLIIVVIAIIISAIGLLFAYSEIFQLRASSGLPLQIHFEENITNKTLTVSWIHENLYWGGIIIYNGSATLPSGQIKTGDIITNCTGHLVIGTDEEVIWDSFFEE